MQKHDWSGVLPAITTPFQPDGTLDEAFLADHVRWLLGHGCRGIVALGSLGEGATLGFEEKVRVLTTCVRAAAGTAPVIAGVSGLSTDECVRLALAAERAGCAALRGGRGARVVFGVEFGELLDVHGVEGGGRERGRH